MAELDLRRFYQALMLADSNVSGERQAAFAGCERILKAAGMTWGDFARRLQAQGSNFSEQSRIRIMETEISHLRGVNMRLKKENARLRAEQRKPPPAPPRRDDRSAELAALRRQLEEVSAERDRLLTRQSPADRRAAILQLLRQGGQSDRAIARAVGVSPQTVGNLRRAYRN